MFDIFKKKIAIYIHWPFCEKKCPYCDFNSHEIKNKIDLNQWKKAYSKEIDFETNRLGKKTIKSIFFGGGTPSLMPIELVEFILNQLSANWCLDKNTEITLEANPSSVEAEKFENLSKIGINRLSLGIQSFNSNTLKFLGRNHSVKDGKNALKIAKKNFQRVSYDLIYGTPEQNSASWKKELNEAISIAGEHISAYQLTIEKGTNFYSEFKKNKFYLPSENLLFDLYQLTDNIMYENGYHKYETSNYSLPECESRHNLEVWRGQQYIGLGPGAHGRVKINNIWISTQRLTSPFNWLNNLLNNKNNLSTDTTINNKERAKEIILTALRLEEGLNLNNLRILTNNICINDICKTEVLTELSAMGLINFNKSTIKVTKKGAYVLNSILYKILV
ncbi:MAG: Oxygen-independent coproporphyrinogen-III oxidase-like protein YqeR [Alphaproteobacteria bacterium MarineAlpha9_Bin2]|nr:MAG: Oxygen-independent coproporphyrinogen-III oxidase-like protein YqeR [Alphaproteobacteria bacterium MarineAlpha9_Bin2]